MVKRIEEDLRHEVIEILTSALVGQTITKRNFSEDPLEIVRISEPLKPSGSILPHSRDFAIYVRAGDTTGDTTYPIPYSDFHLYEVTDPKSPYLEQRQPKCNGLESLQSDGSSETREGHWRQSDGGGKYFEEEIPCDGPDSAFDSTRSTTP